jgi:hypothetical protein
VYDSTDKFFYHVLKYALKENSLPLRVWIFHAVDRPVQVEGVTRSRDGPSASVKVL